MATTIFDGIAREMQRFTTANRTGKNDPDLDRGPRARDKTRLFSSGGLLLDMDSVPSLRLPICWSMGGNWLTMPLSASALSCCRENRVRRSGLP